MRLANAIARSKVSLCIISRSIQRLYLSGLCNRKPLGVVVSLWHKVVSSLITGILCIISSRSKEKVYGIYTGGIVAAVENKHAIGNKLAVNHPRNPMRPYGQPEITTRSNHAISVSVFGSYPLPAAIRLVYVFPESTFQCWVKILLSSGVKITFWLHNKFSLLCRAPGCFYSAGATCLKYAA